MQPSVSLPSFFLQPHNILLQLFDTVLLLFTFHPFLKQLLQRKDLFPLLFELPTLYLALFLRFSEFLRFLFQATPQIDYQPFTILHIFTLLGQLQQELLDLILLLDEVLILRSESSFVLTFKFRFLAFPSTAFLPIKSLRKFANVLFLPPYFVIQSMNFC